jgi:nicotinamide mononucleotide adenylyltransferase
MCELVSRHSSSSSSRSIIEVDTWEAIQEEYQPTALVLDHFSREINNNNNQGPESSSTTNPRRPVRIALLAGADLLQSMNIPGIWSDESLRHIMSHYPLFIVERFGTDVASAKSQLDHRWKGDIHVIPQLIQNNVSSTMIRRFLQSGRSVRYLVPDEVLEYIEEQSLYVKPDR